MKQRIMIFCDYYLPSYKSGGGMWTVVNLVEHFRHKYDFFIVTRNYDSKGDTKPYTEVHSDQWNVVQNANVFYFSKKLFSQKKFAELINEIKPDAFFLNSAFALPVVKFLSARRKKMFSNKPLILAPCGEFSKGALSVKSSKKKIFLTWAKMANLYENIIWKASFAEEKLEIIDMMGVNSKVLVAPDLTPREILPEYTAGWKTEKESGNLRLVFLSRLARKKNIHYLLERLLDIKKGRVNLDIVGPIEDQEYWKKCLTIVKKLPENISVCEVGTFPLQIDVLKKVAESHFFALPTLNENFGYVFIEGMAAGCPIITSNNNVWNDLEEKKVGWRIPLEKPQQWVEKIEYCLQMNQGEFDKMSNAARNYAVEWAKNDSDVEANRRVLEFALANDSLSAHNK